MALAPLPLPVAVIFPDFGILLIPPVGLPPLNPPHLAPAWITAVGVPPVARPANEKHCATTAGAAKKLTE